MTDNSPRDARLTAQPRASNIAGMSESVPAASTRFDVTLVELESELEALLVKYESLSRAWPKEPHAVARAEIGRKVEDALERIGELQHAIVTSPARTLADAAVKLRRLGALLDGEDPARQLLISALAVVETAVDVGDVHVDRARG